MREMISSLTGQRMIVRDDMVKLHLACGDKLVPVQPGPNSNPEEAPEKPEGKEVKKPEKTAQKKPAAKKPTAKKTVTKKPAVKQTAQKVTPKPEEGEGEW